MPLSHFFLAPYVSLKFLHQFSPRHLAGREGTAILARRFGDVTGPTQRLQVLWAPRIAAPVQWRDVTAL